MVYYTLLGTLLALATTMPLAWKWRLNVSRIALFVIVVSVVSGLLVRTIGSLFALSTLLQSGLVWLLTLAIAFAVLTYRFYRDPERTLPNRNDVVVSPADGEVLYIREARGGVLPVSTKHGHHYTLQELTRTSLQSEEASVIGISMSILDVHVNRSPIAGEVTLQRHFLGLFGSLRRAEMIFENERATTVIRRDDLEVAVVQIASRLVRQIVAFVHEGQKVILGQRIGMIRFGSQVDLVLPVRENLRVVVKPGERVTAGQSIIAVLEHRDEQPKSR